MAGDKESFSLNESQTTKTSFKINKVPTNADALTLANQGAFGAGEFVITPDEDVNLSQMRTRVLWELDEDLLTTNFSPQEITIEDDGYDFLEIRYRYSTAHNIERSDTIRAIAGTKGLLTFVNTPDYIYRRPFTLTTRSVITFAQGFQGTGTTETTHNGVCIPISVTGIYKTPAMIYTGAELHEGLGVKIKDGVISSEHPIGSYHICKTGSENPASLFGGTWIQIATNVTIPLGGTVSAYAAEQYMNASNTNGSTTCTFYVSAGSGVLNYLKIYNSAGFKGSDSGAWLSNAYTTMDLSTVSQKLSGVDIWEREA